MELMTLWKGMFGSLTYLNHQNFMAGGIFWVLHHQISGRGVFSRSQAEWNPDEASWVDERTPDKAYLSH